MDAGDPHSKSEKMTRKLRCGRLREGAIVFTSTILTFAFRREFTEKAIREACPDIRSAKQVARTASVLDDGADVDGAGEDRGISRSFWFATTERTMLTHEVQVVLAAGV